MAEDSSRATRRSFLCMATGAAALPSALWERPPLAEECALASPSQAELAVRAALVRVGRTIANALPLSVLHALRADRRAVRAARAWPARAMHDLHAAIAADYREGRTVVVEGVLLSQLEAAVCLRLAHTHHAGSNGAAS